MGGLPGSWTGIPALRRPLERRQRTDFRAAFGSNGLPDPYLRQGDDRFGVASSLDEYAASGRMLPERRECLMLEMEVGRVFFTDWSQCVGQEVPGCTAMSAHAVVAWQESSVGLPSAIIRAPAGFGCSRCAVFAAFARGARYLGDEYLYPRTRSGGGAATWLFGVCALALLMIPFVAGRRVRRVRVGVGGAACCSWCSRGRRGERWAWLCRGGCGAAGGGRTTRKAPGVAGADCPCMHAWAGGLGEPGRRLGRGNTSEPCYACWGSSLRCRLWWFRTAVAWNALLRALHGS
jgi:hypothetical protein